MGSVMGKAPSKAVIKRVFEAAKESGVDAQVVLDLAWPLCGPITTVTATPKFAALCQALAPSSHL